MTVTIQIPAMLRDYCHEKTSEIFLTATTVQHALDQLKQSNPLLYQSICDETGRVRRHVNIFVDHSFLHDRDGLETVLEPGDVLTIMPAVSGG